MDEKEVEQRKKWLNQINKLPKIGIIPNEGDFTKIGNKYEGKIDLLIGGTPCQDISIAGKREGINGKRSSLAFDFVKLAYVSRSRWVVWENVPNVLSSNKGRDFAEFLSAITGLKIECPKDGWKSAGIVRNGRKDRFGIAWRVIDSQYTRTSMFPLGIPQRRRRLFIVGYFGDWKCASKVLIDTDVLQGNIKPIRQKREEIARVFEESSDNTDGRKYSEEQGFEYGTIECTEEFILKNNVYARKFLPVEVERLFGFPDDYTKIKWNNKEEEFCPEAPRLKCCGNSMCVNVMQWIGERIQLVEDEMNNIPFNSDLYKQEAIENLKSFILNSKQNNNLFCYENHGGDSRITELNGVCNTLAAKMGTGGNNVPISTFVMQGFGDYKQGDIASTVKSRDYKDTTDILIFKNSDK